MHTESYANAEKVYNDYQNRLSNMRSNVVDNEFFIMDESWQYVKFVIMLAISVLIAATSFFVSSRLIDRLDFDGNMKSPVFTIVLTIALFAIAIYVFVNAIRIKESIGRASVIMGYYNRIDEIEQALKSNLNMTEYKPNQTDYDAEIDDLKCKIARFTAPDDGLVSKNTLHICYWVTSGIVMLVIGVLLSRIVLYSMISNIGVWIALTVLYLVLSAVAMWAIYKYWFNSEKFMYSAFGYIFNLGFEPLFAAFLAILLIALAIALAVGIVVGIFILIFSLDF